MTHNMKIKYPFYIPENPFIDSLFHTVGFVSHSVKYVSHTVVFVSHSVKQRILLGEGNYIQGEKQEFGREIGRNNVVIISSPPVQSYPCHL